jgi:imidazole glycerol-phosphate synthase subunit HisH
MIAIVDYGVGNLGSIKNMLRKIGYESEITADANVIRSASKLILPGVGAFDTGMRHLEDSGLRSVLDERAMIARVPVLGICLGAQLMTRGSEEGALPGLGWFDADTLRFDFSEIEGKWPLPNVGWREVKAEKNSPLLAGYDGIPRFYFVHSYYMKASDPEIVAMTTDYGIKYDCGLHLGNLHCVQFHPEKSHRFGMALLKNFAGL